MAKKRKTWNRRGQSTKQRRHDRLDQVDELMGRGRWHEAHALLDEMLRDDPNSEAVLLRLAEVSLQRDDAHIFQFACERLYALRPRDTELPYALFGAYLKNAWGALAVAMGRHALEVEPHHAKAADVRAALPELEEMVAQQVVEQGLDGPDGLECLTMHDQVRSLTAQGRYAKSAEVAEKLIARRPQFGPAYNNGAIAWFHAGQLVRAVELTRRLLALQPDNAFAQANLVRYWCALGKDDEARREAERLKALQPATLDHAVIGVEALAWLGDDAGVLAAVAAARSRATHGEPTDRALLEHFAAVAAWRLGREEEARGYWDAALRAVPGFALARSNLDDLKLPPGQRHAPWFGPMPHFVPKKLIEGLVKRVMSQHGPGRDKKVQQEVQQYSQAHPELEGLIPLLLDRSDGSGRDLALHLVGLLRTTRALQAARDFALGPRGPDELRARAAWLASEAGLFPDGPPRLRLAGKEVQAQLHRFEISGEPVAKTHAAGVLDLVQRSQRLLQTGDAAGAERLLREAVAIDPDNPTVLNNLALACAHQGRTEESEALSRRTLERHPDYLFARTAVAGLATQRGQLEEARSLLRPLMDRTKLHLSEFLALAQAQLNLHLAAGELQAARHWLGMMSEAAPDHPAIRALEDRLGLSQ